MQKLHFLSLTTVPIEVLSAQGTHLSDATGFFYKITDSKLFLITNWHVVTGRNHIKPSHSKTGAVPCSLRVKLHKRQKTLNEQKNIKLSSLMELDIKVNSENGNNPIWLEHPEFKERVDVVGIEIKNEKELEEKCTFNSLNQWKSFNDRYIPQVMDDVFVVGYPWGISGSKGAIPIYKKGCIATDPIINFEGRPRLLIDCRTTEGMSGSPVIVSHSGIWMPDGNLTDNSVFGTIDNFLGIYSGRLYDQSIPGGSTGEISEIGVVWKKELLASITSKGIQGTRLDDII